VAVHQIKVVLQRLSTREFIRTWFNTRSAKVHLQDYEESLKADVVSEMLIKVGSPIQNLEDRGGRTQKYGTATTIEQTSRAACLCNVTQVSAAT